MHRKKSIGHLTATALGMAVATQPTAAQVQSAPPDSNGLGEIVVTASKRAERLQDAPVTISALQGDRLQELGISSFADFAALVPSLNQSGGSAPGLGTVIIRGLYSGNFQTNATTATYIGETPFTANAALSLSGLINPDPDLLDVDRVEVLKGPQGTLYGASSLGGLIRILPAAPDPSHFSGQIRIDGQSIDGGGDGGGIRASANVPLTDTAALRIAGFIKHDPGFTTNLATGHSDLGNTQAEGGSAAFKVNISDDWDAEVSGLYEFSRTRGYQFQANIPGTGTPVYGERDYSYPIDGGSVSNYWLVEGTTHYKTDLGTFTGTVSHGHYQVDIIQDSTYTYGNFENLFVPGILPPGGNVFTKASPIADKTTVELRFASQRLGRIEFIGGVFFTDENTQYPVLIQNQVAPYVPLQLPGPYAQFDNIANINSLNSYREYAGFGDATYYVTDDIDLTGGVRYSYNEQVVQEVIQPGLLPLPASLDHFSDDSVLFQGSARWRPSPDLSLYFRAASGYRPGGAQTLVGNAPNIPKSYGPDTTVTYEGGVKGRLFDHRLTYDVDAYHTDWTDIHLTGVQGGVGYVLNGGDATVDGFEAQVDWVDPSGIKLGAALGLAEATLVRISPSAIDSIGAKAGDRLPGGPRWTVSAYAEYHRDLTENLTGSIGATMLYQGDKASSYPGAGLDTYYLIPDYATLNLRAGLDWAKYSVDFRINNVTNSNGITGVYNNAILPFSPEPANAYLIQPRTFAFSFTARF